MTSSLFHEEINSDEVYFNFVYLLSDVFVESTKTSDRRFFCTHEEIAAAWGGNCYLPCLYIINRAT